MYFFLCHHCNNKYNIEVDQSVTDLVIGNSHGRAINFNSMGVTGYNGYISGADVRERLKVTTLYLHFFQI